MSAPIACKLQNKKTMHSAKRFRIQLTLSDDFEYKQWMLIDPEVVKTIRHLEILVKQRFFGNHKSPKEFDLSLSATGDVFENQNVQILLEGAVVPGWEDISILRDGDEVYVRSRWSCYTCPQCGHQMEKRTGYNNEPELESSDKRLSKKKRKKKISDGESESSANVMVISEAPSIDNSDSNASKKKSKKRHHDTQDEESTSKSSKKSKNRDVEAATSDDSSLLNKYQDRGATVSKKGKKVFAESNVVYAEVHTTAPDVNKSQTFKTKIFTTGDVGLVEGGVLKPAETCAEDVGSQNASVAKTCLRDTLSYLQDTTLGDSVQDSTRNGDVNPHVGGDSTLDSVNDSMTTFVHKKRRRRRRKKRSDETTEVKTSVESNVADTSKGVDDTRKKWTKKNIAIRSTLGQHVRFGSDEENEDPAESCAMVEKELTEPRLCEEQSVDYNNASQPFQIITPVSYHSHRLDHADAISSDSIFQDENKTTSVSGQTSKEETGMNRDQQQCVDWSADQNNYAASTPIDLTAEVKNGVQVYSRKWKKRSRGSVQNLSKEEQINSKNTNVSFILENNEQMTDCIKNVKENNVEEINRDVVEEMEDSTLVVTPLFKDYSAFPALAGPPRLNDKLAFKILELTKDYQPVLSDFKEGCVLSYDNDSQQIVVKLLQHSKEHHHGKFDVIISDDEDDTLLTNIDTSDEVRLNLNEMQEVKIMPCDD